MGPSGTFLLLLLLLPFIINSEAKTFYFWEDLKPVSFSSQLSILLPSFLFFYSKKLNISLIPLISFLFSPKLFVIPFLVHTHTLSLSLSLSICRFCFCFLLPYRAVP